MPEEHRHMAALQDGSDLDAGDGVWGRSLVVS
jgi:hypothetical protein